MRFLRTNTAVIVTVGPFYDKTDGVTIETGLTITNERITLIAETDDGSAPTLVLDNITGATAATSNDLNYITNGDSGHMQLELSAANVNRLGRMSLSITDAANHVPVFHEFMVLPAMIYDAFILGTDVIDSSMTQILGTAVSTPATAGILDVNVKNMNNVAGTPITTIKAVQGLTTADVVTTATNVTTVNGLAANVITAASMNPDASAEIADAVWDEDATGHQTGGTFGQAIGDPGADTTTIYQSVVTDAAGTNIAADIIVIEAQADDIGAAGAGLTAVPWNAAWDAEVQSEVDDALVAQRLDELINADSDIDGAAPPTVGSVFHELMTKTTGSFTFDQTTDSLEAVRDKETDIETDTAEIGAAGAGLTAINLPDQTMNITGDITGNLSGSVGSVTGAVGSLTTNNDKTGYRLDATGSAALTEGYATDGATATLPQLLYMIWSLLAEGNASGTTITCKKLDGAATSMTFTIDNGTSPATITRAS